MIGMMKGRGRGVGAKVKEEEEGGRGWVVYNE
jgi:hypothetical protein